MVISKFSHVFPCFFHHLLTDVPSQTPVPRYAMAPAAARHRLLRRPLAWRRWQRRRPRGRQRGGGRGPGRRELNQLKQRHVDTECGIFITKKMGFDQSLSIGLLSLLYYGNIDSLVLKVANGGKIQSITEFTIISLLHSLRLAPESRDTLSGLFRKCGKTLGLTNH